MKCRDCDKKLGGGFQQRDGSHLCARCVTVRVEKNSDRDTFKEIERLCELLLVPHKRATKAEIRKIRSHARAALAIHHKESES